MPKYQGVMTTKRYRKVNKSKETTYEDIKDLTLNPMEQYGFGSWLSNNKWFAAVPGIGTAAVGLNELNKATDSGLEKNAGAIGTIGGTVAGSLLGMPQVGGAVGGAIGGAVQNNYQQNLANDIQNQNTQQLQNNQRFANRVNSLNSQNAPMYAPVMEDGGEITTTNSNSGPKTSSNLIPLSDNDRALQKKLRNYQGILTNAYADTFKSYVDVENELRNKYNDPYKFDRRKLDTYAQDFINTYGDLALTPEQMKSTLGEEAYVDYVNSMNQYLGSNSATLVGMNMEGAKEDNSNQLRFGPRQIIERYSWNLKNNTSPYSFIEERDKSVPEKKYGGTLNYGGQLHEGPNGGVPVDAMGNPNAANPVALVEKGEVSYNTPDGGTYIYSDSLKLDKNKTFAKQAKNIQSRYKFRMKDGVITDSISKKAYDSEMQDLLSKQEELRNFKEMNGEELSNGRDGIYIKPSKKDKYGTEMRRKVNFAKKNGGSLPEYQDGSLLIPDTSYIDPMDAEFNSMLDNDVAMGNRYLSSEIKYGKTPTQIQPIYTPNASGVKAPSSKTLINDFTKAGVLSNPTELYQGMNWAETGLAAAPSIAGSALGLILESRNKNKNNLRELSLGRVSPQQINLGRGRRALRESANLATTNLSRGLRGAAPTSGGYMANMVAGITDIDRNLSNKMSESYTQEELQNAQLRQQTDLANMDIAAQEGMYNTQLLNTENAQRRARINAYISQIGQGVTGALSQKFQSEQNADYLGGLNPDMQLMVEGKGINRKRRWTPRPESIRNNNVTLYNSLVASGKLIPKWLQDSING